MIACILLCFQVHAFTHPQLGLALFPWPTMHPPTLVSADSAAKPDSVGQVLPRGLVAGRKYCTVWAAGAVCPWGTLGYYEVEILHAGRDTHFGFCSTDWPGEMVDATLTLSGPRTMTPDSQPSNSSAVSEA